MIWHIRLTLAGWLLSVCDWLVPPRRIRQDDFSALLESEMKMMLARRKLMLSIKGKRP